MDSRPQSPTRAPNLHPSENVDLGKAKPGCKHCHGRGITAHRHVVDRDGTKHRVPVVCRCVVRRGGVTVPAPVIDPKRLSAGLVEQVRQMAPEARGRLVEALRAHADDPNKDAIVRAAIAEAHATLTAPEPAQEAPHVDPVLP